MSIEMAVWRMTEDGPLRLEFTRLDLEASLEEMVARDPDLVGLDLLVVGQQVPTTYGGFVDILGVDAEARLHVLELKRDRTPRDVVAQTLDYGSWARDLTLDDAVELYSDRQGSTFDEAFAQRFGQPVPDVFNTDQQLTIVASELDPASDRIVQYLAEDYGVPINAVFFRHFRDGEHEYLARSWLLSPQEAAAARGRSGRGSKVRPWNQRDFYVILGKVGDTRWELARSKGLLSAGGGSWYWKPLRNLRPGHRVFAYVGGAGYVGVGEVVGEATPAREAEVEVDGSKQPLMEQPDLPPDFAERARSDDPEVAEYVVPVSWLKDRPVAEAVTKPGLFSSQVTVCKLRDQRTIEVLETAFDLDEEESETSPLP